jgi:hypothetical protein
MFVLFISFNRAYFIPDFGLLSKHENKKQRIEECKKLRIIIKSARAEISPSAVLAPA